MVGGQWIRHYSGKVISPGRSRIVQLAISNVEILSSIVISTGRSELCVFTVGSKRLR